MPKTKSTPADRLIRTAYIHFFYILAFAATIIVYHASNLVAPEAILNRWKLAAGLMVVTTLVWYLAKTKPKSTGMLKSLAATLVLSDIAFASYLVYADRGMASLAVTLYAVPIVTAAVVAGRSAVFAAAALSTAAYAFSTVKYFVDFFNEGYKVQLYSTIGLYAASFFVLALLLAEVMRSRPND